jgi:tetratricopeptide (TPR) repeat protein
MKEKMREKTLQLDEKLIDALPPFLDLLCPPAEDESWRNLEPNEKRAKTFEAVRDLILRMSQERPLILMVDDLHWADKTSEEFLDYLVGWLANTRILLLLLYRPEYTHPWGSKSYYNQIRLDQLPSGTSAELVQSILTGGTVAPEITELILTRAAGNPLFMEELTKTLVEDGSIKKDDHKYILSVKASDVQVPDNVQGIIAARMDGLEDEIKRTMQVASVIGRDFAFNILKSITDMHDQLKSHLLNLQNLEFIYEKSLFPELEYIFRHALTQEVAYNSILLQRRKDLHERIGAAIEENYSERLEEFLEMLSHHYSRSNNLEKSYLFSRLSGEKAIRNNSAWEALDHYKEAMSSLKHQPEDQENKRKQLELLHLILVPTIVLGFPENSLSFLQEGERVSTELGDKKSLIRFYGNIGFYYSSRGNHTEGMTYAAKAFDEAESIEDIGAMAQSGPDLCLSHLTAGDYAKAIGVATRVTNMLEKSERKNETFGGPTNVYPALLGIAGYSAGRLGDFQKASELCEKGLLEAAKIGRPITLGVCENSFGQLSALRGEGMLAKAHYQKAINYLEEVQFLAPLSSAWSGLGYAHFLLGEPEKAKEYAEKGLRIQEGAESSWFKAFHYYVQGVSHHALGNLSRAQALMEEAYQLSVENSERNFEGISSIWLGKIRGSGESPAMEKAEQDIFGGLRILEELGTKPDLSLGYLFLGELNARMGRKKQALENLKKANIMFRGMGMIHWSTQTERILEKL